MHKDIKTVLISEEEIINKCRELGAQLTEDYKGKNPYVIGLLKGSVPFMAELTKYINLDIEVDYMSVSSYNGTESEGDVKIVKDLDHSIKDLDVIIIEDIVDTGKTLKKVKDLMYAKGAKTVKICSLLNKQERRLIDIDADYVGFEVPNEFVVGFGLDFNQKYRNLPFVGVLKEECYL